MVLALLPAICLAERADIVVLKNGDRITGEIKKLEHGRLELKTDKVGTIYIEWDIVAQVTSELFFEVLDEDGHRFYGALLPPDVEGTLSIGILDQVTSLSLADVARIERLRRSFWSRIKGSIDLGLTFTKADTKTEWNFNATANYRTRKRRLKASVESLFRTQEQLEDVDRQDHSLLFQRYFSGHWLWMAFLQGQRNTELSLDFRVFYGAGAGYYLLQTVEQELVFVAGLGHSNETFTDERDDESSAELMLLMTYDLYALGGKDFAATASVGLFPSLTIEDRIRLEASLDFRKELFIDFYLSLRFFDSFDSAAEDGSRNDLGLSTAIGYSW